MNPKEKETKLLREMDIFGVSTARTVASAGDIVEIAAFLHHTQFLPVFPKTDWATSWSRICSNIF